MWPVSLTNNVCHSEETVQIKTDNLKLFKDGGYFICPFAWKISAGTQSTKVYMVSKLLFLFHQSKTKNSSKSNDKSGRTKKKSEKYLDLLSIAQSKCITSILCWLLSSKISHFFDIWLLLQQGSYQQQ